MYGSAAVFAVTPAGRFREVVKVPGAVNLYDVFNGKVSLTVWEKLRILGKGFVQRLI